MPSAVDAQQRTGLVALVERQLETLSPRDRKLGGGLVAFFALLLVGGLWWTLSGILGEQAEHVRSSNEKLAQIQALQAEYAGAAETLESQETRIKQFADQPVGAWIERLAQENDVATQLRAVNETSAEIVGSLRQTHYKVELKQAQYDAMLEFLYALETGGYPARVEQASIRTTVAGRERAKVYDLTLELVAYSVEGS